MSEWNSDHPMHAPEHGIEVWVAYSDVLAAGGKAEVGLGFFDRNYCKWRFADRSSVSEWGKHVVGWLPVVKPTYP